jgi:Vitamin K-dependent gamma-carboxylase
MVFIWGFGRLMATAWRLRLEGAKKFLSVEHHLFGCALVRIGIGAIVLYYLAGHWAERLLLWGPNGIYPYWLFLRELRLSRSPSLLAVQSTHLFDGLYLLALLFAVLFTIGWRTRWVAVAFAVFTWSLLIRNPFVLTGGDNLVMVELPFLVFANSSAYLSADSRWRGPWQKVTDTPNPFLALLHNAALFAMMLQLAIAYGAAGLSKVIGPAWQHGTAIYYVLHTREFGMSSLSMIFYQNPVVVALLTYAVVGFELAFPFLIWSRKTRWIAASGAVALHGAIAIFMRLVPFAVEALVFEFLLFPDASYARIALAASHIAGAQRREQSSSR